MAKVKIEGKPVSGLVVLAVTDLDMDEPGYYALARAAEWASDTEMVTTWRGPDKHDESFDRNTLEEMECSTIGVDEDGFFTCPNPVYNEELQELVKEKAEKLLDEEADEEAAMSWSYDEPMREKYGDDVFVMATFGDAIGINGETRWGRGTPKPPRRWKETDDGGYISCGEEAEIEKAVIAKQLASIIHKEFKRTLSEKIIINILDLIFGDTRDYIYWTSSSGKSEVWVSPKALRAYEKEEEERSASRASEMEKRRRVHGEQRREERRAKIRAGGYPRTKDWSPKGEIPDA